MSIFHGAIFFFFPIERFVSRGLTSSNLCALSISFRLCIGLTVYTYPPFFFSFLIHPFSKWNRHVVIYLFVFYSTDCGEGSREGRSWTPSQKESQLWKEEKLQVWHCCRFLCRNLIRKVSHLFSFSSCVLRLYSNSATYNKGNHWKIGWGKTTLMRVNHAALRHSRQIWNSSWESWKIYIFRLFS